MNISILGFKLNLEILILIGVVYLILVVHTLGGCCRYSLMEAFDVSGNQVESELPIKTDMSGNLLTQMSNGNVAAAGTMINKAKNNSTKKGEGKEGFVGANTNYGQSSPYDLTSNPQIDTNSWNQPNLTVEKGKPINPSVKQFLERQQQQLPLAEGELDFFANVPFKPECCPNTYSSSMGCACMTSKDYNYLILRGGNNVPYSEY